MGKKRKRKLAPEREETSEIVSSKASPSSSAAAQPQSQPQSSSLFLTPEYPGFEEHIRDHYQGFVHCSVDDLRPKDFHPQARAALERLRDANYYQYDVVMAGGKFSSRTFVKRTLVGNPGITYKYLGLRLFAHAWSGPGVNPCLKSIGEMNQRMIRMTEEYQNHQKCQYNLTLINYMEPTVKTKVGFKDEAEYGMGKVSVSWHADSSLETGSSIGVYHCLPTQRSAKWDWRIALRPSPSGSNNNGKNNKTPAKPVVVSTKDGDAYFLLGDFNETHQHCVLAGSQSNRISSTHRVAVILEDTYDYILKRVKIARKRFRLQMEAVEGGKALDAKVLRYCQRVSTEVEVEWIAQYWLQGAQHDKMHTWWQRPMKTLEAYWRALEAETRKLYEHVCSNSGRGYSNEAAIDVLKVLINEFKTRQAAREQWDERRADKIYQRRIKEEYRPVARPLFGEGIKDEEPRLPKDLTSAIRALQLLLKGTPEKVSTKSIPSKNYLERGLKSKQSKPAIAIIENPSSANKIKMNDPSHAKKKSKKKKRKKPTKQS